MKDYQQNASFLCEKKYIRNQVRTLSDERLVFLDGERLGDLDLLCEDPAVCRKVRRIMEKRISQRFWKNASAAKRSGNRARFETRHQLSNHYRNIFGYIPEEYRLSA
jgi:hypothetical protein